MNTIVIKVWRGLVSEVFASDPDTEVIVLDQDCEGEHCDTQLPEHQVY